MYIDIIIIDNIVESCPRSEGYIAPGVFLTKRSKDGFYKPPVKEEFVINKGKVKPSIYKRSFPYVKRDEYKYAFNEKITKTTVVDKDVYYNEDKGKFITKINGTTSKVRTEYTLPELMYF